MLDNESHYAYPSANDSRHDMVEGYGRDLSRLQSNVRAFLRLPKQKEIVGRTFDFDFVDKELAEFFLENDRKAMAVGKPTINEEWVTIKDSGHRVLLETIETPMHDSRGKLIGVLGIGRDITERKKTEQALKDGEEKFRSLAEISQDYIMRYDRQLRHTYMNPAALRVSGLTDDKIIGKTHREAGFGGELSSFWEEKLAQVFEKGQPFQVQFSWESIDGLVVLDSEIDSGTC